MDHKASFEEIQELAKKAIVDLDRGDKKAALDDIKRIMQVDTDELRRVFVQKEAMPRISKAAQKILKLAMKEYQALDHGDLSKHARLIISHLGTLAHWGVVQSTINQRKDNQMYSSWLTLVDEMVIYHGTHSMNLDVALSSRGLDPSKRAFDLRDMERVRVLGQKALGADIFYQHTDESSKIFLTTRLNRALHFANQRSEVVYIVTSRYPGMRDSGKLTDKEIAELDELYAKFKNIEDQSVPKLVTIKANCPVLDWHWGKAGETFKFLTNFKKNKKKIHELMEYYGDSPYIFMREVNEGLTSKSDVMCTSDDLIKSKYIVKVEDAPYYDIRDELNQFLKPE